MKKILLAIGITWLIQMVAIAQNSDKFQIWTDFSPSYNLSEKWRIGGDVGYRIRLSTKSQTAYIRPGLSFNPSKIINFTVGFANFNSWNPDEFTSAELRTFQFVVVSWPQIKGFQFKHRIGLEQRWFYLPGFELNKFTPRARYYLELKSPKFNLFGMDSPFFLMANFEILRDINQNTIGRLIDHNRYTIGVGNHVSERFRAEVRLKIINLVDPDINEFVRDIGVLRLRFYYKFGST